MSIPSGSEILACLRTQAEPMAEFMERLTLAESPSDVPESQQAVRAVIIDALERLDLATRTVKGRSSGGHLYARPRQRERARPSQLMLGHYDTVWPLGTLSEMPFSREDNLLRGPGLYDMKGGLTQVVFALQVLRELGAQPPLTPLIFFNSDEEIGSHESTRYIRMLARRVARVFVLEPSLGPSGQLKTARKGVGRFTVTAKGKAAHAGLNPEAGASAIHELAFVIQKLFMLNDPERGVTVNVGSIDGGLRPNVVAPQSRAIADVRVRTQEDAERIEREILSFEPITPGVTLEIEGGIGRPALEPTPQNQALWRLARELGSEIGMELEQGLAGGGSDGNTTSQYTATLDGLGPVGDGAHAHHEHLLLDRTIERAALLAMLIMAPAF